MSQKFGQPEKKNWAVVIAFWAFIVVGIVGIIMMVATNPKQGTLVCDNPSGQSSLTYMGSCHTE